MGKYGLAGKILCAMAIPLAGVMSFVLYFLYSGTGMSTAIDSANSMAKDILNISMDMQRGSVGRGLEARNLKVDVFDIVVVSADHIIIDYEICDIFTRGALVLEKFKAENLKVELTYKADPNAPPPETTWRDDPNVIKFKISFPINIVINDMDLDNFAYLSDIVDVRVDKFQGKLTAIDNTAMINGGHADGVYVELKETETAQVPNEDIAAPRPADLELEDGYVQEGGDIDLTLAQEKGGDVVYDVQETDAADAAATAPTADATVQEAQAGEGAVTAQEGKSDEAGGSEQTAQETGDADGVQVADAGDTEGTAKEGTGEEAAPEEAGESEVLARDAQGRSPLEFLPTINMPLNVGIIDFKVKRARYVMKGFDTEECDAFINVMWNNTILQVMHLVGVHPLFELELKGLMDFQKLYNMDVQLNLRGNDSDDARERFDGIFYKQDIRTAAKGDLNMLDITLKALNETDADLEISFSPVNYGHNKLEVGGTVNYFAYPLAQEEKALTITNSEVHATGYLEQAVNFNFATLFTGYGFEDFSIAGKGIATLSDVSMEELAIVGVYNGSDVNISSRARIDYGSGFLVSDEAFSLNFSDGGFISSYFTGPMTLESALTFGFDENDQVELDLVGLSAALSMNHNKATIEAKNIRIDGSRFLEADNFEFRQGENVISMKGHSGINGLNAQISLVRLHKLVDGMTGNMRFTMNFKGSLDDYGIVVRGNSNMVRKGDFEMHDFVYNAKYDSVMSTFELITFASTLKVAKGLQASRQCALDVVGVPEDHFLKMGCGGVNSGYLNFKGGYNNDTGVYSAEVENFVFNNEVSGSLELQNPVSFTYDYHNGVGKMSEFKLSGQIGTLDLSYLNFEPNSLHTELNVRDFDLKNLSLFLEERSDFRGRGIVNLDLDIKADNYGPDSEGDVSANMHTRVYGKDLAILAAGVPVMLDDLDLQSDLTTAKAVINMSAHMKRDFGTLDSQIVINDPLGGRRLGGHFNVSNLNLGIFTNVGANSLNMLQGTANIGTTLGGNLKRPALHGDIALKGSLEPRMHVGSVEEFDISLKASGYHGDLNGQLMLNGGPLNLRGTLDWGRGANGEIRINTSNLPLFLLGYGTANVNLNTDVRLLDDYVDISGSIMVPSAKIKINSIENSAIMPSEDEEVVDAKGLSSHEFSHADASNAVINLNFSLGDSVTLEAFGLNSNVIGNLRIFKTKEDEIVNANGEISLERATANLFGHRFIVNRADSIFKGNIANPRLDAEVVADPDDLEDDVEVGVHITGPAESPQIDFFSKPEMSRNEIISYMLYGHGLDKSSAMQDSNNSNMILGLGLSSTTSLVNTFVGALGLGGVKFNTQGSGDDTQVAVQGYVTRKIRLSYGYGVFNSVGEFKLRYELLRKLYVEMASSIDQAVDLIYSFEFD